MVRCEILARLKPLGYLEYGDYYAKKLTHMDAIMEELYGTSSHVDIGYKLGILCDKDFETPKTKRKKKKKKTVKVKRRKVEGFF